MASNLKDKERLSYLYDMLSPSRKTRIVDVGASPVNAPNYEILLQEGWADVIGFEPDPSEYDKLVATDQEGLKIFPHAVGDGGDSVLKVCAGAGLTSLFQPNEKFVELTGKGTVGLKVEKEVEITTKRLDDIDEISDFDLLKIDIQGGEEGAFNGARQKLVSASMVCTEVAAIPLYIDQPLFDRQMHVLGELDFQFHKILFLKRALLPSRFSNAIKRRFSSQIVDGDVIFIKSLLELSSHETEKLKHLVVLSDYISRSYDLSLKLLEILCDRGVITDDEVGKYITLLPDDVTF